MPFRPQRQKHLADQKKAEDEERDVYDSGGARLYGCSGRYCERYGGRCRFENSQSADGTWHLWCLVVKLLVRLFGIVLQSIEDPFDITCGVGHGLKIDIYLVVLVVFHFI